MNLATFSQSMSAEEICHAAIEHAAYWETTCMVMDVPVTPDLYEHALRNGVFPWNNVDHPRMWWSPDPRAVLDLNDFHISRSLAKSIRQANFNVTFDQAFDATIEGCSARAETWLDLELQAALNVLHERGIAHSAECWRDDELVGGVYGMEMNGMFIGDSMFYRESNASKVALAALVSHLKQCGFAYMDCQVLNGHTESLGVKNVSREKFRQLLNVCRRQYPQRMWHSAP